MPETLTTTRSALLERAEAIVTSAQLWAEETERLARLADELGDDADEMRFDGFSLETLNDVARRARDIAHEVREREVEPEDVVRQARELAALIGFFAERSPAREEVLDDGR